MDPSPDLREALMTICYRLAAGAALGVTALGVAAPAQAYFIDSPQPWTVTTPTAASPEPTPQPGPLNPQARPDGSVSTATVPGPAAWTATDLRPVPLAAPVPQVAATPSARRPVRKPATPAAPRVRRVAHGVSTGTWHVVEGETLSEIAALNRTSVDAIVRANLGRHPRITRDYVQAEWTLRIPAGAR